MKYLSKESLTQIAQNKWTYILTSIGIPSQVLRNQHQPCPMCGGKDRFRYDDKQGNGTYFCNQCGAGNGFNFVMAWQRCDFATAMQTVATILGLNSEPYTPTPSYQAPCPSNSPIIDKLPRLTAIWQASQPLPNTPASKYLHRRGISQETITKHNKLNIRFHPALPYWIPTENAHIKLGEFPAMIGAITNQQGELQGLHLTYLQHHANQWQKLNIYHPQTHTSLPAKKIYNRFAGSIKGNAVHLDNISEKGELVVCEGIETAFATKELFGLPVWACLNANNLAMLALPNEVKKLLIVADNDTPRPIGFEAAHQLAIKAIKQGITTSIWQSQTSGFDALDELNRIKQNNAQ